MLLPLLCPKPAGGPPAPSPLLLSSTSPHREKGCNSHQESRFEALGNRMSAIPRGHFLMLTARREAEVPRIPAMQAAAFAPQPKHPREDLRDSQNLLAGIKSSLGL